MTKLIEKYKGKSIIMEYNIEQNYISEFTIEDDDGFIYQGEDGDWKPSEAIEYAKSIIDSNEK